MTKKILLTNRRRLHWSILAVLAVVFILYCPCTVLATTYYVNPGESIQDAIDGASYGDTVQVAAGTYVENITLKNGVAVIGEVIGNDPNNTIIDGNDAGSVIISSNCDPNTFLDGFTITNGSGALSGYSRGGGMYNDLGSSSPTVTNCVFSGNSAYFGGGMYNDLGSSPMVTNCTFGQNSASKGGGMYNSGNPTVTNCTFNGNTASITGGGMYNYQSYDSSPTVTNCTFKGNSASDAGGGMYNYYSSPTLTNCSFIWNWAYYAGGGMYNHQSSPTVINCILWANSPDQIDGSGGTLSVTYSDIQDGWSGTGNINVGPLFVGGQDLRLLPGSPCIDAGDNTAVPPDTTDLDGDGDTAEPIPFDLDGNPRILNGIVDMGAYEFDPELPCGLVGKWPGDEHAYDIVGGNHGTLMNGATYAPGKVNLAFSLDGVDDYVQIPYDPSFNSSSFTLQAWVKFTQNTNARIISRPSGGNPEDGFSFFSLSNAYGKIGGGVQGENGSNNSISSVGSTFNDDTWHLCTFVHDIGANRMSIYVDAYEPWWYDSSPGGMEHNLNGINIGSYDGSKWFFEGLIDEVAIYNCALDADEIWDIFLAGSGEGYTPLDNNVIVEPVDPVTETQPVTVTFDEVTEAGVTSVTATATGPTPPTGFYLAGTHYDLTTTASYSPPVTVCIEYDDTGMTQEQEDELTLYHFENGGWVPVVPCSVDTVNNTVCGSVDSFSLFAIFQDVAPPEINSISANPNVLWPANHKMVKVTVTVDAEDNSDPAPVSRILGITSNEPINGPGDGKTDPDWQITGNLTVKLRAERAGGGKGRVYTIHVECTDASGNTATATADVTVPHDQGKGKKKGKK